VIGNDVGPLVVVEGDKLNEGTVVGANEFPSVVGEVDGPDVMVVLRDILFSTSNYF
jgi:hypothetical protein